MKRVLIVSLLLAGCTQVMSEEKRPMETVEWKGNFVKHTNFKKESFCLYKYSAGTWQSNSWANAVMIPCKYFDTLEMSAWK
jgi:hypothetical protein